MRYTPDRLSSKPLCVSSTPKCQKLQYLSPWTGSLNPVFLFFYVIIWQIEVWWYYKVFDCWSNKSKPPFTVSWYLINLIIFSYHFNPHLHLISVVFLHVPLLCIRPQLGSLNVFLLSPQSPRLSQQSLQTDWRTCGQTWPQSLLSSHGTESWPQTDVLWF